MKNLSPKEAIALLRNLENSLDSYCGLNEEGKTAFRMAIKALNCSEIPNSSDTISRQAAIDALRKMQTYKLFSGDDMLLIDQAEAQTELMMLPSAEPEREKGEWVYNSPVTMKCNRCGLVIKDWDWHRFKICPNCGADMRGGENDGCSQVFEREESDV